MQMKGIDERTGINCCVSVDAHLSVLIFAVFYDWNKNNTMLYAILSQTD